jgi:hypothetical protein
MTNGSLEWPGHGEGGRGGALLTGEEDGGAWPIPVKEGGATRSVSCARTRRTRLEDGVGRGETTTTNFAGGFKLAGGEQEGEKGKTVAGAELL